MFVQNVSFFLSPIILPNLAMARFGSMKKHEEKKKFMTAVITFIITRSVD